MVDKKRYNNICIVAPRMNMDIMDKLPMPKLIYILTIINDNDDNDNFKTTSYLCQLPRTDSDRGSVIKSYRNKYKLQKQNHHKTFLVGYCVRFILMPMLWIKPELVLEYLLLLLPSVPPFMYIYHKNSKWKDGYRGLWQRTRAWLASKDGDILRRTWRLVGPSFGYIMVGWWWLYEVFYTSAHYCLWRL